LIALAEARGTGDALLLRSLDVQLVDCCQSANVCFGGSGHYPPYRSRMKIAVDEVGIAVSGRGGGTVRFADIGQVAAEKVV
jgi:hypothetical protein